MDTHRSQKTVLTTSELAARLAVKPDTVRRWARLGVIPAMRAGCRTLRFNVEAVILAMSNNQPQHK